MVDKKHNATPPTLAPPSLQKRTRTRRHKSIASNETIENPGKHNERWRRGLRERDREESFSLESSLFSFLLSFFCSFSRFPFSFLSGLITKFVFRNLSKSKRKRAKVQLRWLPPWPAPHRARKVFFLFFFLLLLLAPRCFSLTLRKGFPGTQISDSSRPLETRFSGSSSYHSPHLSLCLSLSLSTCRE